MFTECTNLTSLDLSGFDTSNVVNMSAMFSGCSELSSVNLTAFNTSQVTLLDNMFHGCSNLTSVDVNSFNTENVRQTNHMFYGCSGLTSLDLSNFYTGNVTNMNEMFCGCTNLSEIKVTKGKWVTTHASKFNVFSGTNLPGPNHDQVTFVSDAPVTVSVCLLTKSFASGEGTKATPTSIEITGDDKTVDYAVGDHIPFKLEATMPESISAYEKYKLVFHDKITDGMSYDQGSVKVYADGMEITDASAYAVEWGADGKTLTVTMNDVKAAPFSAAAGTKITVKYTTTLLEEGADGAANEASLDYSNDPNGEGIKCLLEHHKEKIPAVSVHFV